ncbi:MAG TPA: hypothetical protein VGN83_10175 [Falsiroseomonas sp.]|nr:hypothetical protein [Falsiroseomonas sp.]
MIIVGADGVDTLVAAQASLRVMLLGEGGDDLLKGGAFADTLDGGAGNDILRGLAGQDVIDGGDGNDRLIGEDGNDWLIGASPSAALRHHLFVGDGQNISLNYAAAVLPTQYEIGNDAFGSLVAVSQAVGARLVNNDPTVFEKVIVVIGGDSNTRFGVYHFEDRDHNTTVNSTDILRLLAIGTGDVPSFGGISGFRLTNDFDLV